jgi:hypothetical protein
MNQRTFFIAVAILLIVIAAAIGYTSAQLDPEDREPGNATAPAPEAEMNERLARICASPAAYERLKQAVFAQAIRMRPDVTSQLQAVGASSVARMEDPLLIGRDDRLNVTVCTGRMILELPPGSERAFGGQRRLVSDVRYTAQPAADRSGLVYRVEGAEPILRPLAALQLPLRPPAPPPVPVAEEPQPPADPAPEPQPQPQASANPSFSCAKARTRGERMVCASPALAAKDRTMSNFFYSALEDADVGQRQALQRTRNNFLAYRDRCTDEACVSQAYDGRMREIRDIMRGIY